jgi:hypothetical protein
LEGQKDAAEKDLREKVKYVEDAKERFRYWRAQYLGFSELMSWFRAMLDGRRQRLAQGADVQPAFRRCLTNQGPFGCTGAFDGNWDMTCTTPVGTTKDGGLATVNFGPDGWVEVRMMSSTRPNDLPFVIGGKINSAGQVAIDRSERDIVQRWTGEFKLVTTATANSKPIGGGNYLSDMRDSAGRMQQSCRGSLKLY